MINVYFFVGGIVVGALLGIDDTRIPRGVNLLVSMAIIYMAGHWLYAHPDLVTLSARSPEGLMLMGSAFVGFIVGMVIPFFAIPIRKQ